MLRRGHGGLYKALTKEARGKRKAKRRVDQMKFIDIRFERWQVLRGPFNKKILPKRLFLFLVNYVEERLWWPRQSPNKGRKKKAKV